MNNFLDLFLGPWPWYVAGPLLALVFFLAIYFGKSFGVSSTLRTICAAGGAGRFSDFFRFDWKEQSWNLFFVAGALFGGAIASNWLMKHDKVELSDSTTASLVTLGIDLPNNYLPDSIFSWSNLTETPGFIMMVVGGFLVGFGTRYAGGCTSGHAITGLSTLQLPSLVATAGFFIGGLIMTHFLLPYIISL